jgi:carboxylesterase
LERDHDRVGESGRTIVRLHDERTPRAAVLFHGLTASPLQFVRYADALFERGYNVIVPRLPRHGHADRLSTALATMTFDDLAATARESVAIARELGDQVTVAGFSLGGLIAAWLAMHEPVERTVSIAPFLGVSWIANRWLPPLMQLAQRMPNKFQWWDPRVRENLGPDHGYPRFATHAIVQMFRMVQSLQREAASRGPLSRKTVIVVNASEAAVNNRAIVHLYNRWLTHRPGAVELVTLTGLPPSHDVIEPLAFPELATRVFPQVLAAIDP